MLQSITFTSVLQSPLYLIFARARQLMFSALLRLVFSFFVIDSIESLGLGQPVNVPTSKSGDESLGLGMRCRFAVLLDMLLVLLGSRVGCGGGHELVGELGLVCFGVVDLRVGLMVIGTILEKVQKTHCIESGVAGSWC